jgi:hypothetical protein
MTYTPTFDKQLEYFRSYQSLGGTADRRVFFTNLQRFFDLTFDAYVCGRAPRNTAWAAWTSYIGHNIEAARYFQAVDRIDHYT